MNSYRAESKKEFSRSNGVYDLEEVKLGCLQRIADATEVMSRNHSALVSERDMYERWYREQKTIAATLRRRVAALQGVMRKQKKQLTALQEGDEE
jgi:hypothetical protein